MNERTGPAAILRTAHVGFTVADLDAGIALFEEVFGYVLASRGGRDPRGVARLTGLEQADITVAHLERAGLTGVELIAYALPRERADVRGRPCDTGFVHLSFEVADMDPLLDRAARHGLVPIGRVVGRKAPPDRPGTGKRVVYLADGNGIAIELIEPS